MVGVDLEGDVYESTWTIERATKAGYVPEIDPKTGKYKTNARGNLQGNEKYITDPIAMLKAKAQSEVCREMAPDVLLGISYTSEELESERWMIRRFHPRRPNAAWRSPSPPTTSSAPPGSRYEAEAHPREAAAPAAEPPPQDAEVVDDPADNTESNNAGRNSTPNEANPDKPQVDESAEARSRGEKPEPPADNPPAATAPSSDLEKSARASLTGAIFSLFGEVDLAKKENHEDRLVVIEAIVGRQVASSNELTTDELQKLRNSLHGHSEAGTLADAVNDWLNAAALKELEAEEAQASND